MNINAQRYSDSAPALDTLKETYIYGIAAKIAQHVRPTRQEINYIQREIRRQQASPTGVLLRGWLFDFTPIMNDKTTQLTIF